MFKLKIVVLKDRQNQATLINKPEQKKGSGTVKKICCTICKEQEKNVLSSITNIWSVSFEVCY